MIVQEDYIAVIGDMMNSKTIKNRKEIQQKFKQILDEINHLYQDDIASKLAVTLGDEFQGLLKDSQHLIKIIMMIEMAMDPIELRVGIGIGEISTDIYFEHSAEVDGPAYHRARQMIEEIEKNEAQYTKHHSSIMICSGKENGEIDGLLNSILSMCTALKSKWTARQKEIIFTYLTHKENQYKAADALSIDQSSVNKALKAARFYSYKAAMDTVSTFLSKKRGR